MNALLLFLLFTFSTFCAEINNPENVVVIITDQEMATHQMPRNEVDPNDAKCCNSNNKVKLALVGLAVSVVGAVTTLIIHFTQCEDKK